VTRPPVVRVPASSANLGAGFDVLALALALSADLGVGSAPEGATALDEYHPAVVAFAEAGGRGPIWMRSSIPQGRGLGFSGVARVGGAALACLTRSPAAIETLDPHRDEVFAVAAALEGHGDNVAASTYGGIVAAVDDRVVSLSVGSRLRAATVVAWTPSATMSTDRSRAGLPARVDRRDAVHNLGRVAQFVAAVEQDDPELLRGAADDRLHQADRVAHVPGAAAAIIAAVDAGAWCAWLSGSGPTVAAFVGSEYTDAVVSALPDGGQVRRLGLDLDGVRVVT